LKTEPLQPSNSSNHNGKTKSILKDFGSNQKLFCLKKGMTSKLAD